ncbi:hypothetical protein JZO86_14365 [Enterococcus ureasiticus]|nr:hypothetical protein [Enterococcus ureasiticus]
MNEFTRYCKTMFINRNFWTIQWLNLMYVVKYRLIIIGYSLAMSFLYVELTNSSSELFTKMQSEAIVSACVSFFILMRHLWLFISLGRLCLPNADQFTRAERWNNSFRQMLFVLLVTSSKYLKTELIFQNISVESIPIDMISNGISAAFFYLSLIFCIRQFWKRLDKQMILSDITSKESLEVDVCHENVHFANGWNEFVRVLETGITYKYSQTGNLFYMSPSAYAKDCDTKLERKVTVSLKYSLITGTLNRLTARMIITNGSVEV